MKDSQFSYNDLAFSWRGEIPHAVEVFDMYGNTVALVSNTRIGSIREGSYYCIGNPSVLENIPELSGLSKLDVSAHYAFVMKHLSVRPRNTASWLRYNNITGMLSNPNSIIRRNSGFCTDTPLHTCLDVTVEKAQRKFRLLRIDNQPKVVSGAQVGWGMAALQGKKVSVEKLTPGMNMLLSLSAYDRAFGQLQH